MSAPRGSPRRRLAAADDDAECCCSADSTAAAARMRLAIVDRIEEVPAAAIRPAAGQLRVQLGEAILPLAGVNGDLPAEKVRLFRLNDGNREIGYAFREVIDLSIVGNDDHPGRRRR